MANPSRPGQPLNNLEAQTNAGYKINFRSPEDPQSVPRSTAYTEIIEVAPNRLLLIYDRTASGWEATSPDSDERNRIFILPVEIIHEPPGPN